MCAVGRHNSTPTRAGAVTPLMMPAPAAVVAAGRIAEAGIEGVHTGIKGIYRRRLKMPETEMVSTA